MAMDMSCVGIGLWLGMGIGIGSNLNRSLLKHIVPLTIISGSQFKHGKHRVLYYMVCKVYIYRM